MRALCSNVIIAGGGDVVVCLVCLVIMVSFFSSHPFLSPSHFLVNFMVRFFLLHLAAVVVSSQL